MENLLFLLIILCVASFCVIYDKRRRRKRKRSLLKHWNEVRRNRQCWKYEHRLTFDFHSPEYQELWDAEIVAEISCAFYGGERLEMSWSDYYRERREADRERSW